MRLGSVIRLIRIRRGLRQSDLAALAGVSQATISRIERGHIGSLGIDTVRDVSAALDVRVDFVPRWRGGDLDRLLNARHSRFHEIVARRFREIEGWTMQPEVSFGIYGERGVIDILAFNAGRRMLLVVELKTDIADVNELVGAVDRKRRHAVAIAAEHGLAVDGRTAVSVWVIVSDGDTNRRRIAAHRTMLRAAFPTDGRTMSGWLIRPEAPIRALSIWSTSHGGNACADLRSIRRVSVRRSDVNERGTRGPPTGAGGQVGKTSR
jgi:transcriptional regulator with XRE-family HTH domain